MDVLLLAGAPTLQSIALRLDDGTDVTGKNFPIEVGTKIWVTAYGTYSDGSVLNINSKVFYSSTDPRVAVVFDYIDSQIRGISVGTADISAEWQGKKATVTANIVPPTAPVLQLIQIQEGYCATGTCPVIDTSGSRNLKLKPGEKKYITAWASIRTVPRRCISIRKSCGHLLIVRSLQCRCFKPAVMLRVWLQAARPSQPG